MSKLRPRTRLVTVRLSEAEYQELKRTCGEVGAGSFSEFARDAILHRAQMIGSVRGSLAGDLTILGEQLKEINEGLKVLSKRIERVLGKTEAVDPLANA